MRRCVSQSVYNFQAEPFLYALHILYFNEPFPKLGFSWKHSETWRPSLFPLASKESRLRLKAENMTMPPSCFGNLTLSWKPRRTLHIPQKVQDLEQGTQSKVENICSTSISVYNHLFLNSCSNVQLESELQDSTLLKVTCSDVDMLRIGPETLVEINIVQSLAKLIVWWTNYHQVRFRPESHTQTLLWPIHSTPIFWPLRNG